MKSMKLLLCNHFKSIHSWLWLSGSKVSPKYTRSIPKAKRKGAVKWRLHGSRSGALKHLSPKRNGMRSAKGGGAVLYVSLEMNGEAIANRLLAAETGIAGLRLRVGNLSREEYEARKEAATEIGKWHLAVHDRPASVGEVGIRPKEHDEQQDLGHGGGNGRGGGSVRIGVG